MGDIIETVLYEVKKINSYDHFVQIKDKWDCLYNKRKCKNITLTYDWTFSTWKSLLGHQEIEVVIISEDKELKAVFPLKINRTNKGIQLIILTSIIPFLSIDDNFSILNTFYDYINKNYKNIISIEFQEVDFNYEESNELINWLDVKKMHYEKVLTYKTPVVYKESSYEKYYLQRKKKIKKATQSKYKKLNNISSVHIDLYEGNDIMNGYEKLLEIDCNSWKNIDKSDLCSRIGQFVFYENLLYSLARLNIFKIYFLVLDSTSEPIAFELVIDYGSEKVIFKHSYKENYRHVSPGVILRDLLIKKFYEEDFELIDTWGRQDEFKMIWTDNLVNRYSININLNKGEN